MAAAAKSNNAQLNAVPIVNLGFHDVRFCWSQKSQNNRNIFMRLECLRLETTGAMQCA